MNTCADTQANINHLIIRVGEFSAKVQQQSRAVYEVGLTSLLHAFIYL